MEKMARLGYHNALERSAVRWQARLEMLSRFFFSLVFMALLAGCHTTTSTGRSTYPYSYHKVHVTDYRGNAIADWVAEGDVRNWESGYRFNAVERVSAPPHAVRTRYPLSRKVYIDGPNITIAPCRKPAWLVDLDEGGRWPSRDEDPLSLRDAVERSALR